MKFRSREEFAAIATEGDSTAPSFDSLGNHITSLLEAAEDAAEDIRKTAKQEAEDLHAEAERYSAEVRRRADASAAENASAARADAERIVRAAEERAKRIEESAVEHQRNLVAEAQTLQELLDDRRRWLQEMIAALHELTRGLEIVCNDRGVALQASRSAPGEAVIQPAEPARELSVVDALRPGPRARLEGNEPAPQYVPLLGSHTTGAAPLARASYTGSPIITGLETPVTPRNVLLRRLLLIVKLAIALAIVFAYSIVFTRGTVIHLLRNLP